MHQKEEKPNFELVNTAYAKFQSQRDKTETLFVYKLERLKLVANWFPSYMKCAHNQQTQQPMAR